MTEVLSFQGVGLRRSDNAILSDIDWSVDSADRWVILGPNGAGKTSLISIASARLHPSAGDATVLGLRLGYSDVQELRIRVGLASAALADRLPADETVLNVVMTAAHGVTGRWREEYEDVDLERAEALLAAFGMQGFADRRFWTLSEGERKRVQIGRALMADPELLLLDEPAAGLDLGGREELLAALTELAGDRRSPAMVLVTHHVEEIPVDFTHALLLREGRIVAAGPLHDTLTSANLSETYGMPVSLHAHEGRWTARRA
ncbi:ABC transporter ATP-binding protein [Demequina sp. NBRC 110057]|uniref:ABC transporter ATP-binding protein n=1 Tax=Demequina sp. NBRC 110057 TaxID=1570346 RepID=UPI0009FCBF5B|nr:ABC transporter ATP-binding protein [Demequina sp. NBRC 110057]